MRRMVEAWSTFLFLRWSAKKSAFFGLVSEQIDFFWVGQRKNQLFWGWSVKKSAFLRLVSEKVSFFWEGMSLGTRDTCFLINFGSLWAWQNLWGYGRKVHAKFWPWGTPYDQSYDHFCVFVSPVNSPILINFKYMRSINPGRYLITFLIKFPFECHRNHVWGSIFDPCYDHVYKCDYFE